MQFTLSETLSVTLLDRRKYILINALTPWLIVIPEKLIVVLSVKKFLVHKSLRQVHILSQMNRTLTRKLYLFKRKPLLLII
jgi:hypothetical protein